ncbi:MAG: flavin reductase [Chloroflexi bacterium]|nr:flavin reductase [Chloroflexota bacterium]
MSGSSVIAAATGPGVAQVMDLMPYGLYIVGSSDAAGEGNGMMADWVMQVSFQPRLLSVAFENDAHTLENIRLAGGFTVNLLCADEEGRKLAARFAQPYYGAKVGGRSRAGHDAIHHKLAGVPHTRTAGNFPILAGALAWLECRAEQFIEAGDHTLVIARVLDGKLLRSADPLTSLETGWTYSG